MKLSNEQIELADKLINSGVTRGIVSQMMGVDRTTLRRNLLAFAEAQVRYNETTRDGGD